ncbi:hypothetical protein I601_1237 [Nocardioides dokdonensis FR1436]|uniref:Uncharacterized protein n=1 Tax=Nocardioides dokdonensis FR1436 TaxID=1300347 RepID=A0A1A9GH88_9ACTN|nr:hypothetical protein [Nocardioides dokdonensis]ANH37679.1 hypothetical protein I601_1237 [Nocardioides dokdonensis FR1436]
MAPLSLVASGLLLVALVAPTGGYDVMADWAGWALVVAGLGRLPAETATRQRPVLIGLAVVAGLLAAVLWFPQVSGSLGDADPSIAWALSLPQLLVTVLLAHELGVAAAVGQDAAARRRWFLVRTVAVVVAVLPVLVYGAGVSGLEPLAFVLADLLILTVVVMLLVDARRAWAGGTPRDFGRSAASTARDS